MRNLAPPNINMFFMTEIRTHFSFQNSWWLLAAVFETVFGSGNWAWFLRSESTSAPSYIRNVY